VGEFAKLPQARVASRLGQRGRELHATAQGIDPQPLIPREPPPVFHEGLSLEWPLVSLEPFLFMGRAALERLCRRLEACGLACSRLEVVLRLEPDGHQTRAVSLPAPTCDVKTLLTLVRLNLEETPPGAPVAGFTFLGHPDRPREAQLSLYGPAALSPDKLATTLARLFALLGADRVGSPNPVDGHRPECFSLIPFAPPPPPEVRREPRPGRGLLAVRVLRPAVALEVITKEGEEPDPAPVEIRSLASEDEKKRLRIEGRVKVAAGPWGLEEGWWTEDPTGRDYWDVELTGGIYRIFHERQTGEWFADGVYD
jgi:protein ImuB